MEAADTARAIATAVLGRDPGPMAAVRSGSHHVHLGADVVVKIIDADGHPRLGREVALAPHLPGGLTAPLLGSGLHRLGERDVRYACYARLPGTAPGIGLPGLDGTTARLLAEQAVRHLGALHRWTPPDQVRDTLAETGEGFAGRAALVAGVEDLVALDRERVVPGEVLDGLSAIADRAPRHAVAAVPVHADCHWGNWLAHDGRVTALLDFEWARLGEPVDDWFFLVRFSGPHLEAVLDVVARATGTPPAALRARCEVREAAYLLADLRAALEDPDPGRPTAADLRDLADLTTGRRWWRHA